MNRDRDSNANGTNIHWEYFINPSKAASPQFDELCRGLASIIRTLEPSRDVDLSPTRLASFYRSCGGNYDELFQNTGEHGIAFLYRTLGCYHSLQPTRSAFDTPSIPCLTDDGYVRWQTLQLLLCPEEHADIIQKALQIYQVPRKNGGYFPRYVPRECFPARPDVDMEKWHRFVTSQISQENYQRRLKYSPYQSPQPEGNNSPGGYFARAPPVRRPSPNFRRRESVSEEELARQAAAREAQRRRSSVPDIASPNGTLYSQKEPLAKSRSRSANRPKSGDFGHQRQRSYTTAQTQFYPPASPRITSNAQPRREENYESSGSSRRRYQTSDRERPSASRSSTASDDASEDSYVERRKSRLSGEDNSKRKSIWGSSLMPNFFLSSNRRRHSSDGRVPTLKDDSSSPRRNNSIRKYKTEGPEYSPSGRQSDMPERPANSVRFSNSFNPNDVPVRPDGSPYQQAPPPPPPTSYRYSEPQNNIYPTPHVPNSRPTYIPPTETTPLGMANNHFEARKQGLPVRVSTVSGVNGRRYMPPEAKLPDDPATFSRRNRTSSMRNFATSTVI